MILFKKTNDLHKYLDKQGVTSDQIGFVPTMGALHAGHLSLIEASEKACPVTVCSIFVNPTQFNDPGDFAKYPRTMEADILLLEKAGCNVLFLPENEEIYPNGTGSSINYQIGQLETILEGASRPGHFQGVCRVVDRLLGIIAPGHLFLGRKDLQQCLVIGRLLELKGWSEKIRLHFCPTLREKSGLAMSSRNQRLNADEKNRAAAIFKALEHMRTNLQPGPTAQLTDEAIQIIKKAGMRPDYLLIADGLNLEPVTQWDGKQSLTALAAAFMGEVRLIDNIPLNPST